MAVHVVALVSKLIYDHKFSWTINSFSLSPDVIQGSFVSTIPGLPENFCIKLKFEQYETDQCYHSCLNLYLMALNVKNHHLTVSNQITLLTTEGEILKEQYVSSKEFKGSVCLLTYNCSSYCSYINKSELSRNMNLLDDKLVVKGKISISGYDTDESVCSRAVKHETKVYEELMKDFKSVYESGSSSDIAFSVGDEILRAHKLILMSHSPVFAIMFSTEMVEKDSNKIVIEDTDFHSFNCFLVFLYTGILKDENCDTLLSLYYLAHKYQVKSLHAICSRILGNSMVVDCVCRSLELSHLHGDKELKDVAKVFIKNHIFEIAGTTEWAELVISRPELAKEVLAS